MKRSQSIRLLIAGGVSVGSLVGCKQQADLSADNVYTNNFYLPGAGYYHAPFRGWYQLPYNHFDPQTMRYFYGGRWGKEPMESITNISSPMPQSLQLAQNMRTDISRGGFGGTSSGYHYWGGG